MDCRSCGTSGCSGIVLYQIIQTSNTSTKPTQKRIGESVTFGATWDILFSVLILHHKPVAPHHNFIFGHLLYLKKFSERLPRGAHFQYMFSDIYLEEFQDGGVFYLDMWPLSPLFQAVVSPTAATTVTQTNPRLATRKPDLLPTFFEPLAGGSNLFEMPESEWRKWRNVFSKGFSAEHFLMLVPGIVQQSRIYVDSLRKHALEGDTFSLDQMTVRFTMDLIGKTILYLPILSVFVNHFTNVVEIRSSELKKGITHSRIV